MKTMKSVMTTVSVLTETVEDLKGLMKLAKEERKEVDSAQIKRENKAKQARINKT